MTEINIKQTFNLVIQYHKKNNLNEAKKIYLQILKINPNHVNAHNNLGAAYKQLGKIEYKALEEFCNNFNFSYDVLAVSFYTKQIDVKLKKL